MSSRQGESIQQCKDWQRRGAYTHSIPYMYNEEVLSEAKGAQAPACLWINKATGE